VTKHENGDGTTFTVRTFREIVQSRYVVTHSTIPTAGGTLLRIDDRMFLVARGQLVPIRHPEYDRASADKAGADAALRFFADSYRDTLAHAEAEGIPVRDCFA
jgi:hypothetical protein